MTTTAWRLGDRSVARSGPTLLQITGACATVIALISLAAVLLGRPEITTATTMFALSLGIYSARSTGSLLELLRPLRQLASP